MSWDPNVRYVEPPLNPLNWLLVLLRTLLIVSVIYSLLILLILVRLIEALAGSRAVSPLIVQLACRISLFIMGIKVTVKGQPMAHKGAVVCNHGSWLDIFTLNAPQRAYFVSKAEVNKWPLIGFIARTVGTVFIQRKSADAAKQKTQFESRLEQGDRLLFFPEGTSTDTRRVLPFKSTLFAAFFEAPLVQDMWIQPMSLCYHAPKGKDPRFYGWWGDMPFAPHFLRTLGTIRSGGVTIKFHQAVRVQDYGDRKQLARYCENVVREGLDLT